MSAADVDFLRRMFDALVDAEGLAPGGLDQVEPWWHPEIEYIEDPKWPGSGAYRGREEVLRVWNNYLEVFGSARMDVEEMIDAGDEVVAVIRVSGVSRGAEVPFEQRWAYVCRFRDGKLAYWRAYFDSAEGLAAAGVDSP